VLQLFNGEERSRREFAGVNNDHREAYKDAITAYGWFYPVVEFISMLALAAILTWGRACASGPAASRSVWWSRFLQYGLRFFPPDFRT